MVTNVWQGALRFERALRLYLVMDLQGHGRLDAIDIAAAAIRGGVSTIQLRDKKATKKQWTTIGAEIRELCKQEKILLIINDRIDVAQMLQADGVHLGQDDQPVAVAREVLGDQAIIGMSAGNPRELVIALNQKPDYLGIGAVYPTTSKSDAGEAIGTALIDVARRFNRMPIVGIGGIHAGNVLPVVRAGASGVAVLSAIAKADDPEAAAAQILIEMNKHAIMV
jgi:thiamine-phosphate pyrophosphorylase